MKILITGANGLLGSKAVSELSKEHEVHALVRQNPRKPIKGVNYHFVDLATDWDSGALPQRMDAIFHLAQSNEMRNFPEKAQDIFSVNQLSTEKLLQYARDAAVENFIFTSSGGIYGPSPDPIHEDSPIRCPEGALNFYFKTKYASETLIQQSSYLMNTVVLRPFFIYGAGQNRTMLIPRLFDNIYKGQPITLLGNEGIQINPIHVEDAVLVLKNCLSLTGHEIVNIAGPNIVSIRELCEIIGSNIQKKANWQIQEGRPLHAISNIDRMKELLHSPQITVMKGIADVANLDRLGGVLA